MENVDISELSRLARLTLLPENLNGCVIVHHSECRASQDIFMQSVSHRVDRDNTGDRSLWLVGTAVDVDAHGVSQCR